VDEEDTYNEINQKMATQYKLIDHPADYQIDYNSMIDFLEEEHMRRDVFTTRRNRGRGKTQSDPSSLSHD
jgi:hypothetical protein